MGSGPYREAIDSSRPWRSLSAACHPSQAERYNQELRNRGYTSAHFDPQTGIPQATDRNGRNGVLEVRKMFDQDGGYGDRT